MSWFRRKTAAPNRTDLRDTTFLIPVKIDHPDRARNLRIVAGFLLTHFDTQLIVCEQDTERVPEILAGLDYTYMRTARTDGYIHRTRQLNLMCRAAATPWVVNHDADVLVPPRRYRRAVHLLRRRRAQWILPHRGRTYDIPTAVHEEIARTASLDGLGSIRRTGTLLHDRSVGGMVFFDRDVYIEGGLENERFIAWGFEDNERFERFHTLGYRLARLFGPLCHLTHHRTTQSDGGHPFFCSNKAEFERIRTMNPGELRAEISTWEWAR